MRQPLLIVAMALGALATTPRILPAQVSAGAIPADSVREALGAFSLTPEGLDLNGKFTRGSATVERGDTVTGPFVTLQGDAEIFGRVTGGVYALWGNVTIHSGAEVLGGVGAYRGRVIIDGGEVRGALKTWSATTSEVPVAAAATPMTTGRALRLSVGWTGMLVAVGLLVLVLASANLEATARAIEQDFGRAFFAGVVGQLGFLPALLLLVVALTITLVGVLLVPFALVAAPVALAGFVTLGWLSLALLTGRALLRTRDHSASRAEALRAIVLGILVLMLPWVLASAFYSVGTIGMVVRIVAIAATWAAATVGLGATLISRGGNPRPARVETTPPPLQGWQTPTPVAGVATARRPIPARPGATPQ